MTRSLVGVCTAHHLHCIHRGWIRVSGRAPEELVRELGVDPEHVGPWC